ncbi:unnamed protein product, partial [Closterium sp. NIES-53]
MVVTVGKYVTPGLIDIDGNGIASDFRRKPSGEMARWKLANCCWAECPLGSLCDSGNCSMSSQLCVLAVALLLSSQ